MESTKNDKWIVTEPGDHKPEHKIICEHCGNDTFRVYIKIIIDDAELFCAKCAEPCYG